MSKFDWNKLDEARAALLKRAQALKQSFVQMPGGAPDPAAGGMPPGDPAAGGMPPGDPAAMGGAPMDPAAGGMPLGDPAAGGMPPGMDPSMMDMDPSMVAGAPMGVDPATAGMLPGMPPDAGAGAAVAGAGGSTPEPTITITLSQLWDIVTKVLGLAKKIGANGQGVTPDPAPSAPSGGANQDAIKAAVIEALGDMGAMR